MNNTNIESVAKDVSSIRQMIDSELEGIESTVICHEEAIAEIDGRSSENTNVIRAIVRRFEHSLKRLDDRVASLETRVKRLEGQHGQAS
jgi:ubiquinone biosynthesis protein UbiJ